MLPITVCLPQVKAACVAPDSDALWRISPPARRALLDMLQYDQGGSGGGGGWSAYGGGDGDGATAPPVVLEVRHVVPHPCMSTRCCK